MKHKVRDINFRSATRRLIEQVQVILDSYDIPITVRQIFYRLVAAGSIPNTLPGYRKVSDVVRDGRYAGFLDWDKVTDETRDYYKPTSYASIKEAVEELKENFRLDRWKESPWFIIVWVEKATMLGQFYPITADYDVYLTAGRGWGSTTHVWDSMRMIAEKEGKKVRILHFGDLDPSGWGMIDDIDNRLNEFKLGVVLEHVLLDENDIARYSLKPSFRVLAKKGTREYDKLRADPRARAFEERFGDIFQVEVEAVDPAELIRRLRQALNKYHDPHLKKRVLEQEKADLSRLNVGLRKIERIPQKKKAE